MKITKRQLRRIIKEDIDVMDSSTGELLVFDDEAADDVGVPQPDAPEAAALDIMRRLGIKSQPDPQYSDDVPTYVVSSDDYDKMHQELYGKRAARKSKADKIRLDIGNLMDRVVDWGTQVGRDYLADNREFEGRLADIAWDMADAAEMEFRQDEWSELLYHFDFNDDDLRMYIADVIASAG